MAAHRISALLAAAVVLGPATARAQDDPVDPYAQPDKPAAKPKDKPKAKPPEPPAEKPAELPKEQPVDPYSEAPPEEPPPPSLDPADDIDDQVAQALQARGQQLLQRGDAASAKMLFIESLERSPKGPRSSETLRSLRAANKKLGLKNLDDGRPGTPVDPHGGGATGEQPLDPYGRRPGGGGGNGDDGLDREVGPSAAGRRVVMAFSAGAGLIAGLAIAGPESETTNDFGETTTEVGGGAVLAGLLGAGVGFAGSWWLTDRYPVSTGQSVAIASGASWGTLDLALFGDAVTGADSDPNDVWKFAAAGGLLGLGAGTWYAARFDPSEEDLVFVNSLGALGTGAGLLVGVGIQPPEREAYSINALVGSLGGLGIGVALADSAAISSRRMLFIDLGAAAGAALPWALLYPLIKEDGSEDDEQAAGWLSALTLGGGAIAAWYLTRAMDEADPAEASAALDAAPPAVVQRTSGGTWALGAPLPRPMQSPALAPPSGISLGADLVSGRF
ncbi:MAG TPA: hypothetical protein VIG06_28015 [Kofleriaceae bacterium]